MPEHPVAETAADTRLGGYGIHDQDVQLFREGTHHRLWEKLGAHHSVAREFPGCAFALWAPNAEHVSVVGEFNTWDRGAHPLQLRNDGTGIWEGFVPGVAHGSIYKYSISSGKYGYRADKGDPFAFFWEVAPATASVVWDLRYEWHDTEWMRTRSQSNSLEAPLAIYEMHLGSWRRVPEESDRSLTYREMATQLPGYLAELGFTHVEFLPVMEHPFYGSWGYQSLGYFAPTSRYGMPQDFMYLIDVLHQHGIGVILDWVPSHFPTDEHGLGFFDGTHLYEHADPRRGFHPDWTSYIFNYGRNEVRSFLVSSALFWLDVYHADGLRVDAVASMLYNDYSRREGEWVPNRYGGRENLEAIDFLRQLNETVYSRFPDVMTLAEESTAWPMVSRPTYAGGLGFGYKWNMGWMHDTLFYFGKDPVYRKHHHNDLTFSMLYGFTENFVLPLSHDEVVHGKGSLISKMPGDDWQKFANLRLLLGYLFLHPGKKLLFMGSELAQWDEWRHDGSIEWHLLNNAHHSQTRTWIRDLTNLYRSEPCLHELDCDPGGFAWIDCSDWEKSVISFVRRGRSASAEIIAVCNMTPSVHHNYRIGAPRPGYWREALNSDARHYGGSGQGNFGGTESAPIAFHGMEQSLSLTLPPLAITVFVHRIPLTTTKGGSSENAYRRNSGKDLENAQRERKHSLE